MSENEVPLLLQANVSVMIEEVKAAFKVRLQEKAWLDNTTKKRCEEKVDAITKMVAYPDQIDNNTYINDLYEGVSGFTISTDSVYTYIYM